MKPREFDDLVRQKFDQGHFEYNPGNWERLETKMEGQPKKKSVVIWWLPLMAIAAAVTVSMGFATYMKQAEPILPGLHDAVAASEHKKHADLPYKSAGIVTDEPVVADVPEDQASGTETLATANEKESIKNDDAPHIDPSYLMSDSHFGKSARKLAECAKELQHQVGLAKENSKGKRKVDPSVELVCGTFADETVAPNGKPATVSLSGGLNMGNKTSGFTLGATGRKMVGARVYVEGDIALISSNNTQKTAYVSDPGTYASAKMSSAGTRTTTGDGVLSSQAGATQGVVVVADKAFNMYYAQVTPTIGYQLAKRFSVGIGPDFQQALSDTRPTPSTLDRNNVQVAPMFDMGVMGKAELIMNDRFRAALLYREGMNNLVTPMNKYVERNYMQVQIKYTVFRNM